MEYARAYGRKKVTCLTKSNIMKVSDGLFQRVFEEVAADKRYENIEKRTPHHRYRCGPWSRRARRTWMWW